LFKPDGEVPDEAVLLCALGHLLHQRRDSNPSAQRSPWDLCNGWRMNSDAIETLNQVALGRERDEPQTVKVLHRGGGWSLEAGASGIVRARGELSGNKLRADLDGKRSTVRWLERDSMVSIIDSRSKEWRFKFAGAESLGDAGTAAGGQIKAPMPGRVIAVFVEPGARITSGQALVVVEAMKMEHSLRAPRDGIVISVACKVGDQVEEGRELVVLES
jgi:3-methylcrotonyl-CoA carboxylase alpha subunit